MKIKFILVISTIIVSLTVSAQSPISLDDAFSILETNNYRILLAKNNVNSAEVLTSKYNSGYRPTVGLSASSVYSFGGQSTQFNVSGDKQSINNASSIDNKLGVSANYLLFDGGFRKTKMEQNEQNLSIVNLSVQNSIQQHKSNLGQLYYQIAKLEVSKDILYEGLEVSQERYLRTQSYYEFGQRSKVDVLNAEIDIRRDSLSIVNLMINIKNLKTQFNQLLVLPLEQNVEVDTFFILDFESTTIDALTDELLASNISLKMAEEDLKYTAYNEILAEKLNKPRVNVIGGYNLGYSDFDKNYQSDYTNRHGLNLGLNLNWNLADGGTKKVQEQLAVISTQNKYLDIDNLKIDLKTSLHTIWNTYQTNLMVINIEKSSIEINQLNFERVRELYNNGQQTSIEFRQAQLNLLNAKLQYTNARYQAKINEVIIKGLLTRL